MAYSFDARFDRDSIRRQFRLSIALIVAMAVAAFVLGFSLPVDSLRHVQQINVAGELQGRLVTIDE